MAYGSRWKRCGLPNWKGALFIAEDFIVSGRLGFFPLMARTFFCLDPALRAENQEKIKRCSILYTHKDKPAKQHSAHFSATAPTRKGEA